MNHGRSNDRIDGWWSHRRIRKESRALVGKQTVSWSGEAHALHSHHSGEPFAASRVCDERSGKNRRTALDPAPASQPLPVSLDFADAFIDTPSFEGSPEGSELWTRGFSQAQSRFTAKCPYSLAGTCSGRGLSRAILILGRRPGHYPTILKRRSGPRELRWTRARPIPSKNFPHFLVIVLAAASEKFRQCQDALEGPARLLCHVANKCRV